MQILFHNYFFNRAFDQRFIETGHAYGNAGDHGKHDIAGRRDQAGIRCHRRELPDDDRGRRMLCRREVAGLRREHLAAATQAPGSRACRPPGPRQPP